MATLEKIRSKSVLLFTVIIVALLAFILGDFFNSGRSLFGNGTTVAKIGDNEIDVQLYQQRLNEANQQMQAQGQQQDPEMMQAQVLQQMLFESMMNEEINALGIVVTDKELADFIALNPQTAQIIDAIKNPGKYNLTPEVAEQLKSQLASLERETETQIKDFIYGYMFNGLLAANELDAKEAYNAVNQKFIVSFTSKELASLPDDKFPVSDDEIKAEWNKNKGVYALENEMRTIDFFSVLLNPSAIDNANADKIVKDAVAALNNCNGVEAIAADVNFNIKNKTYAPSQIKDLQLKNFVDSAKVGQAGIVSKLDKTYSIAKILSSKTEMDSINISVIQAADTTVFDSIMKAINGGAKASSFISKNDQNTKTQGADSVWIQLSTPNTDPNLKAKLLKATAGQKIVVDTVVNNDRLQAIYVVNKTTPAVKISEVAEITYVVEPSQKTIDDINGKLNEFLAKNTTAEEFAKNAAEAGYSITSARIDATTSLINGFIPETRSVVKWAMNADKGAVSTPFANRDNDRLIVAAVTGIYNDYMTVEDQSIKNALTEIVRNNKKAESIINDLNSKGAKDLAGYTALTGDTITNASVTFSNTSVNTLGNNEYAFIGKICAGQKGQLFAPFKTNKAVVVAQITDITTEGRPYNFKEYSEHYKQIFGAGTLLRNMFGILKGNDTFESKLLDFYENN